MRPMIPVYRAHRSDHTADRGALVCANRMAPRELCGPVPEPFVVMPRPIKLTHEPVVVSTVPLPKLTKLARCRISRYSSPVPVVWNQTERNLVADRESINLIRHPAINEPVGPVRLSDAEREQARLAIRAIRAILWSSKLPTT